MNIREQDRRGFLDAATAAALLGMDVEQLRTARARHQLGRGEGRVGYGVRDLYAAALLRTFAGGSKELKAGLARKRGYALSLRVPAELPGPIPEVVVDTAQVAAWVTGKVLAFRRGARRVVSDPRIAGGVPVFRGTRIPVEQIGQMLLRGAPEDELREDFPSLSAEDLEYARTVVKRGPRPGRPRKAIELRR